MTNKEMYEKERLEFYEKVDAHRRIDNSFARDDDLPLTEKEIREIDDYWGKYSFAYPNIDYRSFQTFKNRVGYFDVHHIPGAIRTEYLAKHFVNKNYSYVFQHKAMLPYLYPDIQQPAPVVAHMNTEYFDGDYNLITRDKAIECIYQHMQETGKPVIVKPNMSSGGHNITILTPRDSVSEVRKTVMNLGITAFIAQEVIKQGAFNSRLCESSVNTIRMTSLFFDGKITPLAALIRIGKSGSKVDNWCSGGSLLGVDIQTGKCNNWVLTNDLRKSHVVNNMDLREKTLIVPNFDKVKQAVIKCHSRIPYIRMMSWDIALDINNEPTLIECNIAGMLQIHEAVTGPLFGELTDSVLDTYLLKRFSLKCADDEFVYSEFHDHVVIDKYIGQKRSKEDVKIPKTFNGKPVTSVSKNAFSDA